MRIFEILTDKILDLPLFEMAMERKHVIQNVRGLSAPLALHLIKYYAFDDQAKNHWLSEITSFLEQIDSYTLKPKGKKLDGSQYYSLLWDEPLGNGVEWLEKTINNGN